MHRSIAIAGALVTLAAAAAAAALTSRIELRDVPESQGEWQEGSAIIPAPRQQVQAWLTDYDRWLGRFPDIEFAKYLGDDDRGRHIVRFRSKLAGRTFVIHEAVTPGLIVFEGTAPNVYTQGRIFLIDLGDGSTRVVMQSAASVRGFIGVFATQGYKRKSAYAVTRSHLGALLDLAHAR